MKFNRTIAIPALVTIFGLGAVDSVDDLQVQDMGQTFNGSIEYEVEYDRSGEEFVVNAYVFTQSTEESFSSVVVKVYDVVGDMVTYDREEYEEAVTLEPGIPFYMRFSFDQCKECRSAKIFFVTENQ